MEIADIRNWQKPGEMSANGHRILVIGKNSSLLEGVADLLQLAGYHVDLSSTWSETAYALRVTPPNLAIVDLSSPAADAYDLSEQIHSSPQWTDVPILFVSFSGDNQIRDLQRSARHNNDHRHEYYAHTLLGVDGLLDKVGSCLT